jgi:serine/threonine protein kinase
VSREGLQVSNYQLSRLLEKGEFTEVYLGEHIHLKRPAVVRVLLQHLSDEDLAQYIQEISRLMRLVHPNIVRILDAPVLDGMPLLIMEYVSGASLRQLYPHSTRLPLSAILPYVRQIASALSYAHQRGIVHGNLTPEHILFDFQRQTLLVDFAIPAMSRRSRSQSHPDDLSYTSPERLQAPHQLLPASDQFALGVLIYEWLCGRSPFTGTPSGIVQQLSFPLPLTELVPDTPPMVNEIVLQALQKDPRRRYSDIAQFADAFEQSIQTSLLSGSKLSSEPVKVKYPLSLDSVSLPVPKVFENARIALRRPIFFILLLMLLLALSSGLFYYAAVSHRQPVERSTPSPTVSIEQMDPTQLYTFVTSRSPALNDPLDGHDPSHWDMPRASDGGGCVFVGDAMHVIVSRVNPLPECLVRGGPYTNFAFQVQIVIQAVGDADAGLILRAATTTAASYSFLTTTIDSSYEFYKSNPDGSMPADTRYSASDPIINAGLTKPNLLTVIAYGSNFYLYINHSYLNTISDNTYSSGRIGIFAVEKNGAGAEAICTDAKIWLF